MARAMSKRSALPDGSPGRTVPSLDPPIEHGDVTIIMALLGDIQADVRAIRTLLEDDNGEAEAPEDDR